MLGSPAAALLSGFCLKTLQFVEVTQKMKRTQFLDSWLRWFTYTCHKVTVPLSAQSYSPLNKDGKINLWLCTDKKSEPVAAGDPIYSTGESNSLQDELRQKNYRSKIPLLLSKRCYNLWEQGRTGSGKMIQKLRHSMLRDGCYQFCLSTVIKHPCRGKKPKLLMLSFKSLRMNVEDNQESRFSLDYFISM